MLALAKITRVFAPPSYANMVISGSRKTKKVDGHNDKVQNGPQTNVWICGCLLYTVYAWIQKVLPFKGE